MPYVKKDERWKIDSCISELVHHLELKGTGNEQRNEWKGCLNYAISKLIHEVIRFRGLRYHTVNDLMGTLECVKQELYRTVAAEYEDEKRKQNGSVSDFDAVEEK